MLDYITNETVIIPSYYGKTETRKDLIIHVVNADSDVHLPLIDAPEEEQWLVCASVWTLFLIGSYFRYILYEYLFQQYKSNELKPLNILTLVVAVLNHVNTLLNVMYDTLITINNDSLENVTGGIWFCIVLIYYAAFSKIFSFVGGLMMATYRILLIKKSDLVRYRIGLNNLLVIILLAGMTLTIVCTLLDALNDYQHLRRDRCVLSVALMRPMATVLDEYEQSRDKPSMYAYWLSVRVGLTSTGFAVMLSEIMIYVIYFHHLYRHDNSENLRRLLEREVITRRNQRNAITFFTQFCSFLVELIWMLLFILTSVIGSQQNGLAFIRHLFQFFSFASISIIEVLTSSVLRPKKFQLNIYNFIHGLN